MSRSIENILRAVYGNVWAIVPEKLEAMLEFLDLRAQGVRFSAEEIQARVGDRQRTVQQPGHAIAVLPVFGLISHRAHMVDDISGPGGTSTEKFGRDFDAALANDDVGTIVLDVDSPGGSVAGVPELAARIYAARGQKRIVAVANSLAASAAYWIAAAADEIVVTPSGEVGSVGVFAVHTDRSRLEANNGITRTIIKAGKYKAEGNPHEPLSGAARDYAQQQVDEFYGAFTDALAQYRNTTSTKVRDGYGQGRTVTARQAVALGMADRVATLDEVLAELGAGAKPKGAGSRRAASAGDTPNDIVARDALLPIDDSPAGADEATPAAAVPTLETPAPKAEENTVPPENTAAPASGAGTQTPSAGESRAEAIITLASEHGRSLAEARDWIRAGKSVEDVRAEILAGYRAGARPVITNMVDREADRPFTTLGEQLVAIIEASRPGGQTDRRLLAVNASASGASANVPSDGGFLIQKDHRVSLLESAFETGILSSRCDRTPIGEGSDGLEVVYLDETDRANGSRWGGVQVYRRDEADTVTASKPKFGKWECRLEDLMGLAYMTERLMRDATAIQPVFSKAFNSETAFKLDDEIYRGTGVGQCYGILNAPCTLTIAAEGGQTADTFNAQNALKMWQSMPSRFRQDSAWFINQELESQLPQMALATATNSGQLVYMPPGGLANAQYATLFGRPVIPIEHASAPGEVGDVALCAMGQYALIDKDGVQEDESIHVRFIYAERCFRWISRVNGAPKWKAPIKPYKGSAGFKLSPFITLAAR